MTVMTVSPRRYEVPDGYQVARRRKPPQRHFIPWESRVESHHLSPDCYCGPSVDGLGRFWHLGPEPKR
jgi:hypothetical protein